MSADAAMVEDPASVPVPEWSEEEAEDGGGGGGYGPIRGKDEATSLGGGVVFRPAQVDDVVVETLEDKGNVDGDAEGSAPYPKPQFAALGAKEQGVVKQMRRVSCPPHRLTPLKAIWTVLLEPLVDHLKLQVRFNTRRRAVELKNSEHTVDVGSLQKGADYLRAFMLGFEQADAVALLRLDDLFIESFEVKDVKRLNGDHLSRCIGRIAGKDGKTKHAVENATRTRIALCDDKIHILGSFANIRLARDSICNLILGSTPGKVYTKLRTVSKRLQERV
eukprot:NODE_1417_length_1146_cov_255.438130.p1 GENE.NODE_1417_length_1146_cov_255.438130~~NODE_1417_length_1146_cov_255.438130.p1  ORF type:complete len:277 (+),score=80.41 NODE_1417_length_1146_cov_255.438130:109-939(+)